MTRVNTLTEIWNTYNDNIVNEKVSARDKAAKSGNMKGGLPGTKPGKGPVDMNSKEAQDIQNKETTEIDEIEGLKEPIDPITAKDDNAYNVDNYSDEKYNKKLKKKVKESINNYMKSTFDKLFENVMNEEMGEEHQELEALGVDVDGDGDIDVEASEEVTVTLGAEHVKALKEILAQIEPDDEADDDDAEDMEHEDMEHEDGEGYEMEEDEEDDDEDEDDDDETHKEAVDAEDHGHSLVNQKGGNPTPISSGSNVVKGVVSSKAKKDKGGKNSKPSITHSSTEEEGHALVNQKKGNPDKISAGSNKVGGLVVGADLFGDN